MIKGFAIGKDYSEGLEIESLLLKMYALDNKIDITFFNDINDITDDYIPFGNLDWMYKIIESKNIEINIDYYPDFLNKYINRKIWYTDIWPNDKCFIKSADKYKKMTGFIKEENSDDKYIKCDLYACSGIINVDIEWRYYIDNSSIIGAYQYTNEDKYGEKEAPLLDIDFPDNWCGCVDFGLDLSTSKIYLIESQHPFSCGWYGPQSKYKDYISWIIHGWESLNGTKVSNRT